MKLTQRDKLLLTGLVIFLIIVGSVFLLIVPAAKNSSSLKNELEILEKEKSKVEKMVEELPVTEMETDQLSADLKDITSQFLPYMENQQIDKMMTEMLLQMELGIRNLTISVTPEERELTPYVLSGLGQRQNESESDTEGGGAAEDSDAAYISNIAVTDISIKVSGSLSQLQNLVNRITEDYKTIRIVRYQFGSEDELTGQLGTGTVSTLEMDMELYMYVESADEAGEQQ